MKKILFFILIVTIATVTACSDDAKNVPKNGLTSENKETRNSNIKKNQSVEGEITLEQALEVEDEFQEILFPERTEEGLVKSFKTKKQLFSDLNKVADREIASIYIDTYYEERENLLYVRATEGPLTIDTDQPLEMEKLNDGEYQIVQNGENDLRGKYKFTIKFRNRDGHWVITNRIYESR